MSLNENKKFHDFFLDSERSDLFAPCKGFYEFYKEVISTGVYTYRRTLLETSRAHVMVRGHDGHEKKMLMLASNNYMGLLDHPDVIAAAKKAIDHYGYGAGSVALLSGTTDLLREFECELADFYGREAAVVFPTGYSSNVGIIQSFMKQNDLILMDMYSHASLVDGTRMTGATVKLFKHNDMEHLRSLLTKLRKNYQACLIVTDGVFSMDGDLCRLNELVALKKEFNARLLIDEAHGVGVIGKEGRGTESHFGLDGEVDLIAGTLSKAPGGLGGYLVGTCEVVEYVRHFANSYVFSTTLPASVLGGLREVFSLFKKQTAERSLLFMHVKRVLTWAKERGLDTGESETPIIPIILKDELLVRAVTYELDQAGYFVSPVVFPAVSKNQARLRVSLMATHTKDDIEEFLRALEEILKKHKVI